MNCRKCGYENDDDAEFCENCGSAFARVCAHCGNPLNPKAKFCKTCGTPVVSQHLSAEEKNRLALLQQTAPSHLKEKIQISSAQVEGERKPVTILFTDIVGSTALAEKFDPEEWKEIVSGAHLRVSQVIYRYEGTIAQLLGDGVLAFFGAPITHEDDPIRAVHAALDIQQAIGDYAYTLKGYIENFQLRVGLNTGTVVVGSVGSDMHMEYLAIGDTVNLAARLQSVAQPGRILISESTARLVGAVFELQSLGEINLKGKTEAVTIFDVVKVKAKPESGRGYKELRSPLVGRDSELAVLRTALEALFNGHGQIATILGEAGIGKSRLLEEAHRYSDDGHPTALWIEGRAISYGQTLSFWTIIHLFYNDLGLSDGDPEVRVWSALKRRVNTLFGEESSKVLPYLGHLLGINLEGELAEPVCLLDGETLKRQTMYSICQYFERLAEVQPTIMVFEDLHWADPSSLEALEQLLSVTDRVPLLIVMLSRLEHEHGSWRIKLKAETNFAHRYSEVVLKPLSLPEQSHLVDNLLTITDLPDSIRHLILEHAEGNPFYLEEIIRSLIDQGIFLYESEGWRATKDITNIIIPDTLQGVLLARIDQLQEDVRRTLQVASVIGRSFLYRLLEAVAEAETKLDSHLAQLQRVDLVREKTHKPELEYIFKHSLTQEAAYNSLLLERRQKFHLIVAEALENLFFDRKDEYSGMLAHHYERAGLPEQAALYYLRAAEVARQVYANEEVIALLKRGLALVENGNLKSDGDEHSCEVVTRLWEELGDVLELRAQHQEALHAYHSAQAVVPPEEQLWKARLYRKAGVPLREQRLYAQALSICNQAEVILGEPQDRTHIDWWREWTELQVDRIWAHYWLAQWPEMDALVNKVQPVVQEIGGSAIRSRFLMASLMPRLRKERYAISDEMLAISRAALAASQEWGDMKTRIECQFELGFLHLWRHELKEAEENLLAALDLLEITGVVPMKTLSLTYLAVVNRFKGLVDQVVVYASRAKEIAESAHMPDYVAAAKGNLAWLAWRDGDLVTAEQRGKEALKIWSQSPLVYPFQWLALWPLIGVAVAHDNNEEVWVYIQALLEPTQQLLLDRLNSLLKAGVQSKAKDHDDVASHNYLDRAIELAREMGYL